MLHKTLASYFFLLFRLICLCKSLEGGADGVILDWTNPLWLYPLLRLSLPSQHSMAIWYTLYVLFFSCLVPICLYSFVCFFVGHIVSDSRLPILIVFVSPFIIWFDILFTFKCVYYYIVLCSNRFMFILFIKYSVCVCFLCFWSNIVWTYSFD